MRRARAACADKDLGVQRVAFLDEDVDAVEESVDGLRRDPAVEHLHR